MSQTTAADTPDMERIIKEMAIIHHPTSTGKKLVGAFMKANKPPKGKGSINVPRMARKDSRRRFPSPPKKVMKSKIFSLSDSSDSEVKNIYKKMSTTLYLSLIHI